MNNREFRKLLITSLDNESDTENASKKILAEGVNYDFSERFLDRVMDRIYSAGSVAVRESEFIRNLTFVFYRIALSGVAAIILLLLSILLTQGSLSLDSFFGLGNNTEESIISLLTGN